MEEACKNCEFCHDLKLFKRREPPIEFEHRLCCTMFPQTDSGFDAFALEVSEDSRCEVFTERKLYNTEGGKHMVINQDIYVVVTKEEPLYFIGFDGELTNYPPDIEIFHCIEDAEDELSCRDDSDRFRIIKGTAIFEV